MAGEPVNVFDSVSNVNEVPTAGTVVLEGCNRPQTAGCLVQWVHLVEVADCLKL